MLGITRLTHVRAGIRSSTLRQQSKITDATAHTKLSKIRSTGQEPSATGLHGTSSAQQEDHHRDGQASSRSPSTERTTLVHENYQWKDCCPLGIFKDQRESR
ncbi:hypothetical protein ANCDUO_11693 [Ancylostoma duodenale]|uniref:Uncharacterized protein n=1 Tax=Ancylostoma duodenale TaxID=51022 RepID=A0A0C2D7K5_9BILA|nr:hypothetical protein ANCDUO_11693 [Ancylostoma duodenale]